jgi:hypothetical protein
MALPLTLTSYITPKPNPNPPHKSSGGNYYFVGLHTGSGHPRVFKTPNPSTTGITAQDTSNEPTNSGTPVSSISIGNKLHISHLDTSNLIHYYARFDMSSDTWDVVDIVVADVSGMAAPTSSTTYWTTIGHDATNSRVLVAGCGLTDSSMGAPYNRVDLWYASDSITSGSFTGPTSIDATTGRESYNESHACIGAASGGNHNHLIWASFGATNQVRMRTVSDDTTPSLSTIQSVNVTENTVNQAKSIVSYDDAGTGKVFACFRESSTDYPRGVSANEDGSNNVGALTLVTVDSADGQNPNVVAVGSTFYYFARFYENLVYNLSIWSSTDFGATWTGPELLITDTGASYANSDYLDTGKIAYTYYIPAGSSYYDEYLLSADVNVSGNLETLVLTEQTATITSNVNVNANTESLVLTEQQATIDFGVNIAANTASLALTEQQATLTYDVDVLANAEALTFTEQSATIVYDVDVLANTETLTLTEQPASFTYDVDVPANLETLTIAGQQATISQDIDVLANTESLVLTEQQATVSTGTTVNTNLETLVLTENQATISTGINIDANTETLALTEQSATISLDADIAANTETLTLTEQQATIALGVNVNTNLETLTITGQQATIVYDVDVLANTETLSLTGQPASFVYDVDVQANTETLTLTEQQATIQFGVNVLTNTETLNITGQQATIGYDVNINANSEILIISEQTASVGYDLDIAANTETLNITEQQASIQLGVNVPTNLETLAITEQQASIVYDVNVGTNTEALTLTEQQAAISNDIDIQANVETLTLAGQTASIALDIDILANLETLLLTEQSATIVTTGDKDINTVLEQLFLNTQQASISFVPIGGVEFNTICDWVFSKPGYVGTCNDRLYQILSDKGYTEPQLNDRFFAYLKANGYQGALSDKIAKAAYEEGWLWTQ